MVLKAFVAFVIAGIVMAILVPQMHTRGVPLRGWMVVAVMVSALAVSLGPETWRRWKARRE
jgi:hypothetical protein